MTTEAAASLEIADPYESFLASANLLGNASPYPDYAALRAAGPVLVGAPHFGLHAGDEGSEFVMTATSYASVEAVLKNNESFSSAGYVNTIGASIGRTIIEMDPPVHRTYRSILQQAFTKKSLAQWESTVVEPIIDKQIDRICSASKGELIRDLFFPFPVAIIAHLLGLPDDHLDEFHSLAMRIIAVGADPEGAVAAGQRVAELLIPLIEQRRSKPTDDLISLLVHASADGQQLTQDEVVSFCRLLLPAGAETTYRSSGNLFLGLLTHPHQLNAVRSDDGLYFQTIDEALRWEAPLLVIMRTATQDVVVDGVDVAAGTEMLALLGSANHDETRWNEPERFDIFRERRPPISFAVGAHTCLGLHLARLEMEVLMRRVFERLPNLRLDPDHGAPYISGNVFRSPPALHCLWD